MKLSSFSKFEFNILVFAFAILFVATSVWKVLQWAEGQGDSAFVAQLSQNITFTGQPTSELMASIDVILKNIVAAPAETVCAMPLAEEQNKNFNYFKKWHTYLILYVVAPLNLLFSPVVTVSWLTILSFLTLLFFCFLAARQRQLPIYFSIVITLIIATHPAWSQAIQGQLYVDRFFIGLAFLLIYLLNESKSSSRLIFTVGILTTLISDRTGLIAGGIFIAHEAFQKLKGNKLNKINIALGFLFCLFSIYQMKFIVEHPHYGSFASSFSPQSLIQNFSNRLFASNFIYFSFVNLIIFGIFAIFSPYYFLLAIGMMIPNLFGNIGGAEKVGFFTHYHSLYFPVLAWATLTGYVNLYHRLKSRRINSKVLMAGSLALLLFLSGATSLEGPTQIFSKKAFFDEAPFVIADDLVSYTVGSKKAAQAKFSQLKAIIPKHSKIATIEAYMTHFVLDYDLTFYPVGISNVDFVLLPYSRDSEGRYDFLGAPTYLGPEENKKLNNCLKERLKVLNFNVESPRIFGELALLQKKIK